ncbi:MAG: hypothetical protein OXC07_12405 [Kistimonas sp.]|nr:hypothetical protein [Kistimonas sp.]
MQVSAEPPGDALLPDSEILSSWLPGVAEQQPALGGMTSSMEESLWSSWLLPGSPPELFPPEARVPLSVGDALLWPWYRHDQTGLL